MDRVFIKIPFLPSPSRKSSQYKPWEVENATAEENERAKRAYEAVLTVTSDTTDSTAYDDFAKEVKKVSRDMFNYTYSEDVNSFVANFHDAVSLNKDPFSFSTLEVRTTISYRFFCTPRL